MDSTLKIVIEHEPDRRRFVAHVGTELAVLEYSPAGENTLDYYRTYVPRSLRGRGIASELTAHALDYALGENLKIVPSCPFVAALMDRQPKYRALRRP